jgi:hypothetical protein
MGGVLLAVLFFVFGVGRVKEGFYYECLKRGGACGKSDGCLTKCCSGEYQCDSMGSRDTSDDRCMCK